MNQNLYHEKETIVLAAESPQSRAELHRFLLELGFKSIDDFYDFERSKRGPIWQSESVLSIEVLRGGIPIDDYDEEIEEGTAREWDELKCDYLLATLPTECIATATFLLAAIGDRFGLTIRFEGADCTAAQVGERLADAATEVEKSFAPAGSEELAILIEEHYRDAFRRRGG